LKLQINNQVYSTSQRNDRED